jgi:uncharacterized damage-inducible protein DinB
MPNGFLVSLFQHKAWCNRRLVEALRAAAPDAERRQFAVILFTLDHTSIVDRIFQAHLSGEPRGFSSVIAAALPDLDRWALRWHRPTTGIFTTWSACRRPNWRASSSSPSPATASVAA